MENRNLNFLYCPLSFAIFLGPACVSSSSIEKSDYVLLKNREGINIEMKAGVEHAKGNRIYELAKVKYPDTKILKGEIDIRVCEPDEDCNYILTYECEYSCWGNIETRLCGIKALLFENGDIGIKSPEMVGSQIEC